MLRVLLIASLFGLLAAPAQSAPAPDGLDVARIVRSHPDMPARGTHMDAVRADLGQPREIRDAVGEPPITRWIYDEFIVYFEDERVLHSVIPRQRDE